jgi:adenosylcobinamide-GDP ribazoletransferase
MMKRFLIALQFLTIIPVKRELTITEEDIAKSSSDFVAVGLAQGLTLVAVDYASGMIFDRDIVTGMVLLALVLSNGGFHLDGLADTFDAVASKGDKEKKLAVMKDSATGPMGVVAIFFALLLEYLILNNLAGMSAGLYYHSLVLMPMFSKWAMVVSMVHGRPARNNGLGRMFIGRVGNREMCISTVVLFVSFAILGMISGDISFGRKYVFLIVSAMMTYLLCRLSVGFFNRKIGGLTGDTLGAVAEVTQITFLLMVTAWSRLSS